MVDYYVGPGGNDGNSGLTWALRKLTLNGAEDVPVIPNDVVYVGPGVYREMLTCDVSGGVGTEIVYIGDVTGEDTDRVGGIVRITGSDNDQTVNRTRCILGTNRNYRTFQGFRVDMSAAEGIYVATAGLGWTIEDCLVVENAGRGVYFWFGEVRDIIIRRCLFWGNQYHIQLEKDDSARNDLVENCIFLPVKPQGDAVRLVNIGDVTVRNNLFFGPYVGVNVTPIAGGGVTVVENNIFHSLRIALQATNLGDIVENFNTFYGNAIDRTNVNVGANSQAYPPLLSGPLLHSGVAQISGFKFPWWLGELSEWSQIRAILGANEPIEDLMGIARPTTAVKNSWGSVQFHDVERDTTTVRTGLSSLALNDAGRVQFTVPVVANNVTISIYVQREANYAGVSPSMVIKQPGQADRITTDVGTAGAWNLLTDTFIPAAEPPYVMVELASLNTAVAGNYAVYFDDLRVT